MLALKHQPTVDLVCEHENIAVADKFGSLLNISALQHAARGIMRRIENDQSGAVGNERRQFVYVERKIIALPQLNGDGLAADIVNHRLINGKARIGVDDLISFIN